MKRTLLASISIILFQTCILAQSTNVGIGTNNPASKMDVKGNLTIGNTFSGTTAPANGAIIEGPVGVGTSSPGPNAILDVSSTTKGMYMPRLTNAQRAVLTTALGTGDKGLLIFNTDNNLAEFWDGFQWLSVGAGAGGPPTGTAAGDLSGYYPAPQVANNAITGNKILDGTITSADLAANSVNATSQIFNTLPVSNGGTGQSSLTNNGVVYGTGTTGVGVTGAPSAGQVMVGNASGVPSFAPLSGDISAVSGTGAVTLTNSGVAASTYGSATQVPQVTVDTKGRVTSATNVTISGVAPAGAAGGDLTGNYPAPSIAVGAVTSSKILDGTIVAADLAATGVGAGTYNTVIVNTQGQVTGASNAAYLTGNQTITLSGDVSGSGTGAITTAIGTGKVTSGMILDGTIADADISTSAAIQRAKLATGSPNQVVINDGSGNLGSEAQLAIVRGGTNATAANYSSGKFLAYDGTRLSSTAYDQTSFASSAAVTSAVSGTANYVPKFTGTNTIGNSQVFDNGTNVGVGTITPYSKLNVAGNGTAASGNGIIVGTVGASINTNTAVGAETGRFEIGFPGYRDVEPNQIGAKIASIRRNNYLANNALVQSSDLAFFTGTGSDGGGTSSMLDLTSERMRIDFNGNVGVATSAPSATLDVNGSTRLRGLTAGLVKSDGSGNLSVAGGTDVPAGSANYIQNTNTAQASANFNISGNGQFGGNIRRTDHSVGFLEGSYNNVGANSTYSDPIYTIGSSYNPTNSSLSNMYGVGFSHSNFWGSTGGKPSGWGLYAASAGVIRVILEADDGIVWAAGSVRAPIFYDTDNTAYYIDPNGNSFTSSVYANNWFRAQGNSGLYFQDWGGGWNMTDATWIRSYNSKSVYIDQTLRADNGIISGARGNPGAGSITANNMLNARAISVTNYQYAAGPGTGADNQYHQANCSGGYAMVNFSVYATGSYWDGNIQMNCADLTPILGTGWYWQYSQYNCSDVDNQTYNINCNQNYLASGFMMWAGSQLNYCSALLCSPLNSGYAATNYPGFTSAISMPGNQNDNTTHFAECPPGTYVSGMSYYTSSYADGSPVLRCTGINFP